MHAPSVFVFVVGCDVLIEVSVITTCDQNFITYKSKLSEPYTNSSSKLTIESRCVQNCNAMGCTS